MCPVEEFNRQQQDRPSHCWTDQNLSNNVVTQFGSQLYAQKNGKNTKWQSDYNR